MFQAARLADRPNKETLEVTLTCTRPRLVGLVTAGMLCALGSGAVHGQSLADAARRAAEQRESHPATPSLADSDRPGVDAGVSADAVALELTMPILERYGSARTAVLREMVKSPEVAARIQGAIGRAAGSGEALAREYESDPVVAAAARGARMTARDYTVTEMAFMMAVGIAAGKLPPPPGPRGAIAANVEFIKRHQSDIAEIWKEALTLEERLARQ